MDYREVFDWPSGVFPVEHDLNGEERRRYDVDWKQRWDVYGTGIENGYLIPVSVGVIAPPGATMVVINGFDDGYGCKPIALTPQAVEELRAILRRALQTRAEIAESHRTEERAAEHQLLDRAVLTAGEWESVLAALRGSDERLRAEAARVVKAGAPPAWVGGELGRVRRQSRRGMTVINREDGAWLSAWGGRGVRGDDGQVVLVTVGLLAPEHDPRFAVRFGEGGVPVVFTLGEAEELKEAVMYAFESREHFLYAAAGDRRRAAGGLPGDAVLRRGQWDAIPPRA